MASGVYGAALHSFLVTAIADHTEASHLGMAIQSVGIAVSAVPGPVRAISSRKLEVKWSSSLRRRLCVLQTIKTAQMRRVYLPQSLINGTGEMGLCF